MTGSGPEQRGTPVEAPTAQGTDGSGHWERVHQPAQAGACRPRAKPSWDSLAIGLSGLVMVAGPLLASEAVGLCGEH